MIKTTQTLGLTLLLLSLLGASLQAQVKTISSRAFTFHLEKDTTGPAIHIPQEKEGPSMLTVYDRSGIDTIWLNKTVIAHDQDSVYAIGKRIATGGSYLVEAVDRKGNRSSGYFEASQGEMLERGVQPLTQDQQLYSLAKAKYYALLIGIENYTDPSITTLEYPIDDAEKLKKILTEQYTFDPERVTILKDLIREEMEKAFDVLKYQIGKDDNLLIFFAGHGYWNSRTETGFWLPASAKKDSIYTYVRNTIIREYIREIDSHHTLLITDACFSGSILKERGISSQKESPYLSLYSLKSRKAMTSGNLESVPDESIFMKYLLRQLAQNTEDYLPAGDLFYSFRNKVIDEYNDTYGSDKEPNPPQYAAIRTLDDGGGEFIFIRRQTETTLESSK